MAAYSDTKIMDQFISQDVPLVESPDDIKIIDNCKKCLSCGSISGTALIIPHYYNCKYSASSKKKLSYYKDSKISYSRNSDVFCVMEREAISVDEDGPSIGSFGAASCVILVMRNSKTGHTTVAHIDELTTNWWTVFKINHPELDTDLYFSTLNESDLFHKILVFLRNLGYFNIVYVNLASSKLAVDPKTGNITDDFYSTMYIGDIKNKDQRAVSNMKLMMSSDLKILKLTSSTETNTLNLVDNWLI